MQQWSRERASMLRYTYIDCLVVSCLATVYNVSGFTTRGIVDDVIAHLMMLLAAQKRISEVQCAGLC